MKNFVPIKSLLTGETVYKGMTPEEIMKLDFGYLPDEGSIKFGELYNQQDTNTEKLLKWHAFHEEKSKMTYLVSENTEFKIKLYGRADWECVELSLQEYAHTCYKSSTLNTNALPITENVFTLLPEGHKYRQNLFVLASKKKNYIQSAQMYTHDVPYVIDGQMRFFTLQEPNGTEYELEGSVRFIVALQQNTFVCINSDEFDGVMKPFMLKLDN